MKYLITGSSGFIGYYLAKRLLADKNNVIIGIDNMNDYYDITLKESRKKELVAFSNYTFYQEDIANKAAIMTIFEQEKPDYVIHLAAQAGVRYSIDHPDTYIFSNIVGFYNILEACRHYPVKKLLFASSIEGFS